MKIQFSIRFARKKKRIKWNNMFLILDSFDLNIQMSEDRKILTLQMSELKALYIFVT